MGLKSNVTSTSHKDWFYHNLIHAIVIRTSLMSTKHKESLFKVKFAIPILHSILKDLLLKKLKGVPLFIRLMTPNGAIWSLDQRTVIMR